MLLQTVERELRFVVDKDFERLRMTNEDARERVGVEQQTLVMNFLQVPRMSLERVALNIMTCLWCGVTRKISWTSRRMSVE